jgi:hypothetical protein
MPAVATPPLQWGHGAFEVAPAGGWLGDEWSLDERFVDEWLFDDGLVHDGCHDAAPVAASRQRDETALDDELALLASLERTIRWAQAEQYRLIESARARHGRIEGIGEVSTATRRELATRSFVAELATTLVVPEQVAGRLVADAGRLAGPRTATLEALAAGEVAIGHVRSMLEITQTLPADAADEVERVALVDAASRTSSAFRRRLQRLRERLHPEPLESRRARAVAERRVVLEPAPDGMAWLSLFLEAERAVSVVARLEALAAASDPDRPDSRTTAQRSADIAADLLLVGALDGADGHLAAATGRVTARVTVTVPVLSLLGVTDEPAELDGYGPIDAETARRLAGHAPSLQRLLVHPETGAALSYGRTSYRVGADLAGYLRVRDGRCRFPGCARPAHRADLDHATDWARGGATDADNLAHLCRSHHRLKHESGWRVAHEPGGVMRWTSPVGHVLRTHPERPFVAVSRTSTAAPPGAVTRPGPISGPKSRPADTVSPVGGAHPPGRPGRDELEPPWLPASIQVASHGVAS